MKILQVSSLFAIFLIVAWILISHSEPDQPNPPGTSELPETWKEYSIAEPANYMDDRVTEPDRRAASREAPPISKLSMTQGLPTEYRLLGEPGNIPHADAMTTLLGSDEFEITFDQLQEEQAADPQSTELTHAYRDLIDLYSGLDSKAQYEVDRISCGSRVCMGSIHTFDEGQTWRRLVINHLGKEGSETFGSIFSYPLPREDGSTEQRFLLLLSPEDNIVGATIEPDYMIYPINDDSGRSLYIGSKPPGPQEAPADE